MKYAKKTPYAAGIGVHKASTGLKNEKRRFSISISAKLVSRNLLLKSQLSV